MLPGKGAHLAIQRDAIAAFWFEAPDVAPVALVVGSLMCRVNFLSCYESSLLVAPPHGSPSLLVICV